MAKTIELKEIREAYTIGIDPATLGDEPIILEENGKPVGAVISIEEYRSYLAWKQHTEEDDEFPPEWRAEKVAFQNMLPELLKTHRGKWVAIYEGKVVDSDDKDGELIWRVMQTFGDKSVFVDQVLEKPRVYRILSPWVVRE